MKSSLLLITSPERRGDNFHLRAAGGPATTTKSDKRRRVKRLGGRYNIGWEHLFGGSRTQQKSPYLAFFLRKSSSEVSGHDKSRYIRQKTHLPQPRKPLT